MNMKKVYSPGILNELVNKSVQFHNALLEKKSKRRHNFRNFI